jgi:uncharacterized protein (UPF0332 family)/predicted nucleotidyltransferase
MAKENQHKPNRVQIDPDKASEIVKQMVEARKAAEMKEIEKEVPEKVKLEIEKLRKKLQDFKKQLLKKYKYVEAIGILPPQASNIIEDEEEVEKEKDERIIHVLVLLPDEKKKELPKLKVEAIKMIQSLKPRVWLHIKTVSELWEICFDGKYPYMDAISMSFPIHDKGILGSLRVANIHKTLVLKKFERYVVSYVIAGSLVRGQAVKTSDVDVFVVIDDTDVKRMGRYELKEKLRAMIYSYTLEATSLAGVKNKLSPQIYILTEFWEAVKDAHPVIFTFIRDGIPLYDRGAFMPWKLLLKMGKIKPSPEAIDMFMSLGEKVADNVRRKLNDIVTEDIYWGVLTPSQAMLMLYGLPPPTHKETPTMMKKIFVEKEKLLEKKYADILEKIVTIYKKYEHEEIKTITGKEIDTLLEESKQYITRLKQLMDQIEKKASEQLILQLYNTIFDLLKACLGKGTEQVLVKKFDKELVQKGKISSRNLKVLQDVINTKKKYKRAKKLSKHEIEITRKNAYDLISALSEYAQRKELMELEKRKINLSYKIKDKKKRAELYVFKDLAFLNSDISTDEVTRIDNKGKITKSDKSELAEALQTRDHKAGMKITPQMFEAIKKIIGDFEIVL